MNSACLVALAAGLISVAVANAPKGDREASNSIPMMFKFFQIQRMTLLPFETVSSTASWT